MFIYFFYSAIGNIQIIYLLYNNFSKPAYRLNLRVNVNCLGIGVATPPLLKNSGS